MLVGNNLICTARENFENYVLKCIFALAESQRCLMFHLEHKDSQHRFNKKII